RISLSVPSTTLFRSDLQERRTGVEQGGDALARKQLAARGVPVARLLAPALGCAREAAVEFLDQRAVVAGVVEELLRTGIEPGIEDRHVGVAGEGMEGGYVIPAAARRALRARPHSGLPPRALRRFKKTPNERPAHGGPSG